jgi:hypothetical protein
MESLVRILNMVFWVAAALLVASLFLTDFTAGLFGDSGAQVVSAVLLVVVVICSGLIFGMSPGLIRWQIPNAGNGQVGNCSTP